MRRIKKDEERKVKLTVTISPEINNQLKDLTNKSKYIEYALLEYFTKCGLIQIDNDNNAYMAQAEAMVEQETNWASYKRSNRKIGQSPTKLENVQSMSNSCPTEKEKEIEIEKEIESKQKKEIEIEKEIEKEIE